MSKLLEKPHEENSPLSGALEVNFLAITLTAAHPYYHQKHSKNKNIKNTEKQWNKDLDEI